MNMLRTLLMATFALFFAAALAAPTVKEPDKHIEHMDKNMKEYMDNYMDKYMDKYMDELRSRMHDQHINSAPERIVPETSFATDEQYGLPPIGGKGMILTSQKPTPPRPPTPPPTLPLCSAVCRQA